MKSSEWVQKDGSSVMDKEMEMVRKQAVKMLSHALICTRQHKQYGRGHKGEE